MGILSGKGRKPQGTRAGRESLTIPEEVLEDVREDLLENGERYGQYGTARAYNVKDVADAAEIDTGDYKNYASPDEAEHGKAVNSIAQTVDRALPGDLKAGKVMGKDEIYFAESDSKDEE